MLVQQTFKDIDQQAAQLAGYGQQYAQLSPGRFHGVFSSFALQRGMGVDIERANQAMHQCASVPGDTVSVISFLETSGPCLMNGQTLTAGDSIILQPGAALDLRTPDSMTVAVVSLPLSLVEDEADVLLGPGRAWREAKSPIGLRRAETTGALVNNVLGVLVDEVFSKPDLLANERNRAAITGTLLNGLFLAVASGESDRLEVLSPTRRWDVFCTAKARLDEDLSMDVTVSSLCRAAGVSRRTLEYCFEAVIGLSPLQYIKTRRLNGIRSELSAATPGEITVGDVAARYGVWHLGRLSKEYADLFGELPSSTLKGASVEPLHG